MKPYILKGLAIDHIEEDGWGRRVAFTSQTFSASSVTLRKSHGS